MRLGRRIPNKSMERFNHAKRGTSPCWYVIPVVCTFWIIFLWSYSFDLFAASKEGSLAIRKVGLFMHSSGNPCSGKYIYVHKLPSRFNVDVLKNCQKLNPWTNMCIYLSNAGLGPKLETVDHNVFSDSGWYGTNQFSVEVIFHNRMKQYKCLTNDSSLASAIFVPYYAGLDVTQYLWGYNVSMRDSGPLELFDWLRSTPEWNVMGGRDHFFVAGRPTWDFRRISDEESDWGNKLMFLPEATNMTALLVEVSPWNSNDYGIPYPTYFHPKEDSEVFQWQERMRTLERPWLFSFAGAPRPNLTISIRDKIINQCRSSQQCFLMECGMGESRCHIPSEVMKMFETSTFCLQPQGDSYTRRSTFDSMMAGCIPVFFHPGTAYIQYLWHLPRDYKKYSVFISEDRIRDGNASIEHILAEIPAERVRAMREKVISMVPALLYADPRSQLENVEDAFDVAVDGVIQRVDGLRTEKRGEGNFSRFLEKNSWKYAFAGNEGPHEWDHFFFKPKQCRPCR